MARPSLTAPQVGPGLQGLASGSCACQHETVSTPRETEVCAMTIIRTVPEVEATGDVAAIYAEEVETLGYVPPHTRVMATNAAAHRAFEALIQSVAVPLGLRRYELVTLAAARGTGSQHCRLAHGVKALQVFDDHQLAAIARDYTDAGLTAAEVEMMRFAERVAVDASAMTDADALRLRDVGFSDREIVDITIAASARLYLGSALQALAVDVDVPERLSEPLRSALVEGL
jgi:uncharacterized peroxidase-related enzyme